MRTAKAIRSLYRPTASFLPPKRLHAIGASTCFSHRAINTKPVCEANAAHRSSVRSSYQSKRFHSEARLGDSGFQKPVPRNPNYSVRADPTPNPDVLRFSVQNRDVLGAGAKARNFAKGDPAIEDSTVLAKLFSVHGVRGIMLGEDYIAVARTGKSIDWDDIVGGVQQVLEHDFYGLRKKDFYAALDCMEPSVAVGSSEIDSSESDSEESAKLKGIVEGIEEVLEYQVRPGVRADGGDVELAKFDMETGIAHLNLHGACQGCPQATATLKQSIEKALMHYVPECRGVVQANAMDQESGLGSNEEPYLVHKHEGEFQEGLIDKIPAFVSSFSGGNINDIKRKRVNFFSEIELSRDRLEHLDHIFVECDECGVKRTLEAVDDLLVGSKAHPSGMCAVQVCPTCAVVLKLPDAKLEA